MNIQGYKVNFLGDSITEGVGVADLANRYDQQLKALCHLSAANNYGIGGTRLAHQRIPSEKARHDLCFCGRAYNMDATADMVIVYGGVNDYIHGDAPFGAMGDTTPATFCGGVYFLMNFLRKTYGEKPILFLTPARCFYLKEVDDLSPSNHPRKTILGQPLREYVEVILETAKQFGIYALDLYNELGIDPHNPADFENYTVDGLHFNDQGHTVLAQCVKAFIERI